MRHFTNRGGVWSKDFLVFDLETVHDNKDCRCIRTKRCGEAFQKRGLLSFPMLTMEAPGDLVLPILVAIAPEVLKSDERPAAGDAPARAEAEPPPTQNEPPAAAQVPAKAEAGDKDAGPKPPQTEQKRFRSSGGDLARTVGHDDSERAE